MNVITIRPRPATVPQAVTRAQALIALYEAGMLEAVEAAVAAHPYAPVRLWWNNALNFERTNPYLTALAVEVGLTDENVDRLFVSASTRI
ncbi:hypothetical protein AncyloWKF20_07465 [Ancylobacter sp. WKF20]|uniref:hypothetical protein n=1 Tax=Ancylobacter sp. WKF20 TaxID=3039801 RepID=UPI00243443AF|nr:hypothetical protein [Ancylobacter sp. WKF20]WGD31647.1 hypothetical protein AncyloWKF20_07465 [Ancylobacter sp. WKF20]